MNLPLDKMGDSRAILPVSAVIATADRADALAKCIETVIAQDARLKEIVVVDASEGGETKAVCEGYTDLLKSGNSDVGGKCLHAEVVYLRAQARGAATQRNQGVAAVSQPFILFMDDDVELQQGCLAKLWEAMMSDGTVGGVSSMIINQKYANPGRVTRFLYRLVSGERHDNFAGRCLGPAFTVLPEDRQDLPEVVPVEWLNAGCTLYRREALPTPAFPDHFTGYSFAEDVNLSLTVARKWKLVNARTAQIYHYSRPGPHKARSRELAKMSLVNRHYIMVRTLGRKSVLDYLKLALVEGFGVLTSLRSLRAWLNLPAVILGKIRGIVEIGTKR